jgi:hypothetical protein
MNPSRRLKGLGWAMFAITATGPLAASAAPPALRAHYEVTLEKGRSTWTVGSGSNVSSGVPFSHDIGPYRVALLPRLEATGRYTLKVSVGLIPRGADAVYAPDSRSFAGQMAFPLEFTTTLAGTKVTGAIMISPVRNAATPLHSR